MNDINLIPDRILYRNRRIASNVLKVFLGIIAAILVMALLSIRTYQRMELQNKVNKVKAEINVKGLSKLEQAEAKLAELQQESSKTDETFKTIPQAKLKLSELLSRISGVMPVGIVADSISYKGDSDSVDLGIKSSNSQAISVFLKRLHDEPEFVNVNMSDISVNGNEFNCSISIDMKGAKDKN